MNLVPEMNLMRAEKVYFKNTQVLKENLFRGFGPFYQILHYPIGAEQWSGHEPLLFLERSDGVERSSIFGAERQKELTPKYKEFTQVWSKVDQYSTVRGPRLLPADADVLNSF